MLSTHSVFNYLPRGPKIFIGVGVSVERIIDKMMSSELRKEILIHPFFRAFSVACFGCLPFIGYSDI